MHDWNLLVEEAETEEMVVEDKAAVMAVEEEMVALIEVGRTLRRQEPVVAEVMEETELAEAMEAEAAMEVHRLMSQGKGFCFLKIQD